jgi:glutamate decarboxylase
MVYPGVGWVLWRHPNDLPKELVFNVNYLGGQMPTFAINFSRPGNGVIAQYYNFLRLGRSGYLKIQQNCQTTALFVSSKIAEMGPFELLSTGDDLPVFAFTLKNNETYSLYDLSERLRERGWQVPAYTMPKNIESMVVMRIVVKENFSRDVANLFLKDLAEQVQWLSNNPLKNASNPRPSFHH